MRLRGSVTLFLALVLTSCCALICALLESARTAGTRYYAALAANAAVDSLFSRYDRTLFARYRILAYRYPGDERCAAELDRAVQAYRQDAGRYPFFEATICPLETGFLGDGGAVWLEQEMLDYMKTQPGDTAPLTVSLLTQYRPGLTFAEHVSPSVTALSPLFADAAESEALYFRLEQSLLDAGREKEAAAAALAAGNLPEFSQHAAALSAALRQTELASADCLQLSAQLTDGSARFAFSGQAEEAALLPLHETVSETAAAFRARRPEISAAGTAAPALTATVSAYETAAAELAARIAEEAEEDDEDDGMGIDAEALWHSLAADFSAALSLPTLSAASGLRQDAAPLSLAALLRTEPATREALCLPASAAVPAGSLSLTELPSAQLAAAEPGASRSDEDDCLFAHYAASFFPCYLSQTKEAAQAGLSLQLEYLSAGKETDRENFSAVCSRLFADQQSLRLLALLSDPAACSMRSQPMTVSQTCLCCLPDRKHRSFCLPPSPVSLPIGSCKAAAFSLPPPPFRRAEKDSPTGTPCSFSTCKLPAPNGITECSISWKQRSRTDRRPSGSRTAWFHSARSSAAMPHISSPRSFPCPPPRRNSFRFPCRVSGPTEGARRFNLAFL